MSVPVLVAQSALLFVVLAGIIYRRRLNAATAFAAYVALAIIYKLGRAVAWMSNSDWLTWLTMILVFQSLALATAVEIAARIFHRRLRGARARVSRSVLLVILLGFGAAATWGLLLSGAARSDREFYSALFEASRWLGGVALWVFVAVFWAAVVRFNWPVDRYHRDVSLGFAVYLSADLLASHDAVVASFVPRAWPVWLFWGVLALWLRAAWRPDDTTRVAPHLRPFVWPWMKTKP